MFERQLAYPLTFSALRKLPGGQAAAAVPIVAAVLSDVSPWLRATE